MAMNPPAGSPFQDAAIPVLQNAQGIDDAQRGELYDIFHNSKDHNELAQHLQPMVIPDEVKSALYDTKKRFAQPSSGPVDKGFEIINRLGGIDIAEQHPKIATALIGLAAKEAEKETVAAQDEAGKTGKGKEAESDEGQPKAALSPRPDGLPHLPPIPEGHHRILASDGGIHDIPAENIDQARQRDPLLHVLNP